MSALPKKIERLFSVKRRHYKQQVKHTLHTLLKVIMGYDATLKYGLCAKAGKKMTAPPEIPEEFEEMTELHRDFAMFFSTEISPESAMFCVDDIISYIICQEGFEDYLTTDKIYIVEGVNEETNILFNKFLKWSNNTFEKSDYYLWYDCCW